MKKRPENSRFRGACETNIAVYWVVDSSGGKYVTNLTVSL